MADFCTKCHYEHGFPGNPDIDIENIFESLEEVSRFSIIGESFSIFYKLFYNFFY